MAPVLDLGVCLLCRPMEEPLGYCGLATRRWVVVRDTDAWASHAHDTRAWYLLEQVALSSAIVEAALRHAGPPAGIAPRG